MKRVQSNKSKYKKIDFEISFYEGIIKENPDFIDALVLLGDLYTKRGCYKKGLEIDIRLSKLSPDDPIIHYNLACSYSLLKKIDLALDTLDRALKSGYHDYEFMEKDTDLENLRNDNRYSALLKKHSLIRQRNTL